MLFILALTHTSYKCLSIYAPFVLLMMLLFFIYFFVFCFLLFVFCFLFFALFFAFCFSLSVFCFCFLLFVFCFFVFVFVFVFFFFCFLLFAFCFLFFVFVFLQTNLLRKTNRIIATSFSRNLLVILDNSGWFLLVLKELVKKQHFLTLSKNEIEKLANLQCLQEIAINAYFLLVYYL